MPLLRVRSQAHVRSLAPEIGITVLVSSTSNADVKPGFNPNMLFSRDLAPRRCSKEIRELAGHTASGRALRD
jgi:hypothetical protein